MGWRDRDHTRGRLFTSLLVLALPLMGSSAAMSVFQLVDLAFVSRLGDAQVAAVVIVNQTVRQVFFMLVMGGSFGAQALIALAVGEGRVADAEHIAGQSLALGAGISALAALLGVAFPDFLFSLPGPDPSFAVHGVPYLRLVFLLNFGVVGTLLVGAILGGAGDTTTPLLLTVVQAAVALLAEWLLIFGNLGAPALGVRGVAVGVATGQLAAMALGASLLFGGGARVHLRRRHLLPDPRALLRIARLSWPPALQMVGGVLANFAFLRLAGGFGESVQAAFAIGLRLGMVAPAFCFPLATACATLVGQNLGAGSAGRAWQAVRVGLYVHGSVMLAFAAFTFLFRVEIVSAFSRDPEVIRIGSQYLLFASGSFAAWAFYFVFLRALQGAGDFVVPMALSLSSMLLVSIPLAVVLSQWTPLGPSGIFTAQLVSSLLLTSATGAWLATGRWARRASHSPAFPR